MEHRWVLDMGMSFPGAPSVYCSISWTCLGEGCPHWWGGFHSHVESCRLKHFTVALQQAGDFICTVYLEEKKTETEQHVKVSGWAEGEEGTRIPLLYVQASVVARGPHTELVPLWCEDGRALGTD